MGTSYTFRLDNQSFTFEGLTAGVLNKRIKYTFELTETASFFYPSNTVGNCVYEPQIEEGVFATTPGAHPLDFERLISETGIEIDSEVLSLCKESRCFSRDKNYRRQNRFNGREYF